MTVSKKLRSKYKRKAVFSLLLLALLALVWVCYPFREFFSPVEISGVGSASTLKADVRVVNVTDITLHYTGYCNQKGNSPKGYFYYGFIGEKCLFFLLGNDICKSGQESISFSSIRGTVYRNNAIYDQLLTYLAEDLAWDKTQLTKISQPYFVNETGYNYGFHVFLLVLFATFTTGVIITLILNLLFVIRPALSLLPACGFSSKRASRLLAVVEKDLENHCLITAGNFAITRRFLLNLSKTPLIIPIKKIAWAYEHSTVSGFPGRNGKIHYTLTIYKKNKHPIHSTHNQKEDVDTVLSYLRDYYPEILNGFSAENKDLFKKM